MEAVRRARRTSDIISPTESTWTNDAGTPMRSDIEQCILKLNRSSGNIEKSQVALPYQPERANVSDSLACSAMPAM